MTKNISPQTLACDGDLRIGSRLGDDEEVMADPVPEVDRAGLLHTVGLEPIGIDGIVDALADRHLDRDRLGGIPQGWQANGAIGTLERNHPDASLWHPGQALMPWWVGNARFEPRGDAVTIIFQATRKAKP
jgi:phage terminase large subunit-like protein